MLGLYFAQILNRSQSRRNKANRSIIDELDKPAKRIAIARIKARSHRIRDQEIPKTIDIVYLDKAGSVWKTSFVEGIETQELFIPLVRHP